jgi:hypothetical protein
MVIKIMLNSKEEIKNKISEWRKRIIKEKEEYCLYDKPFGRYKIIEVDGQFQVEHLSDCLELKEWMFEKGELPFKFASCNMLYIKESNTIKSFKNFPNIIKNINNVRDYVFRTRQDWIVWGITSLEDFPAVINGPANLSFFKNILSFSNADKHIKHMEYIKMPYPYEGPLLWVFKTDIKGFQNNSEHYNILNKHLHGDRDVLECQEELIINGYRQYAKL